MPYCTSTDVALAAGGDERLRELADWDGDEVADSPVLVQAIASADGWIDGVLSKRFSVPLADEDVTELIKTISMEEAVFLMKKWRDMAGENEREDHLERLESLRRIGTGEGSTGSDPQPPKSTQVVDRSAVRATDKAASRDALKGFA